LRRPRLLILSDLLRLSVPLIRLVLYFLSDRSILLILWGRSSLSDQWVLLIPLIP
jgi:hypothetical protein